MKAKHTDLRGPEARAREGRRRSRPAPHAPRQRPRGLGRVRGSANVGHPWHTRKSPAVRRTQSGRRKVGAASHLHCVRTSPDGPGAAHRRPRTRRDARHHAAPRHPPMRPVRGKMPHAAVNPRKPDRLSSPVRHARGQCISPCRVPDTMKDTAGFQTGDLIPAETCSPQRKQRLGLWASQPKARISARNALLTTPEVTPPSHPPSVPGIHGRDQGKEG